MNKNKLKTTFLLLTYVLLSNLCYAQDNEKIVYIKRYNISIDVGETGFEYNKKLKGITDPKTGAIINFYGKESEFIENFKREIGTLELDSFYLESFKSYLYKSKNKIGRPIPQYFYFGEFIAKKDTISAVARLNQFNEKIEKEIIDLINSARVGDVKGDIYYFRDFEFTGGLYLRYCKTCANKSNLRMTNNGAEFPIQYHRAVLDVKYEVSDQTIEDYIQAQKAIRKMIHKGTIETIHDGEWHIIQTNNLADTNEIEYEYLLKKLNKFFIAKYTSPNIIETRRQEIEKYLSTFRIK